MLFLQPCLVHRIKNVVSRYGLIQERKIGTDEVIGFEVSGEMILTVKILPG